MTISSYSDLLAEAAQQAQPQRLLFTFAKVSLPTKSNDQQKQAFEQQQGGELSPIMCIDKLLEELSDFSNLVKEADLTGNAWDIVFVSTMSGKNGIAPTSENANRMLDRMIESINNGNISFYLAFNRAGDLLQFKV
jgi:hypothetical protein